MIKKSVYIFLILIDVFFFFFKGFQPMDREGIALSLITTIIGAGVYLFSHEREYKLKGNFFKPSNFALLGLLVVNFQIYLDYYFGIADEGNFFIWVNKNIVVQAAFLSSLGINCFLLGLNFRNQKPKKNKRLQEKYIHTKIDYVLYFIVAILAVYYYTINKAYLFGGYGIFDMGSTATYMSLLFHLLIYVYIIQKVRNGYYTAHITNFYQYVKYMRYSLLVLIVVFLISVLLSGDRGPIIQFGLIYLSGYFFITKKKMKPVRAFLLVFVAGFLMNFLGNVRSVDKNLTFSEKVEKVVLGTEKEKQTLFGATYELAGSLRTLHYAVDYVDRTDNHMNGRFLFQQVFNTIPFTSFFYPIIFDDLSNKYKGSASFFTWLEQGDYPSSGVGSSVIADFYIDTGLLGVILGMLFFGYLMRYLDVTLYQKKLPNLFVHSMLFVYITIALYIARSELLSHLRMVLWVFVILVINKVFINRQRL